METIVDMRAHITMASTVGNIKQLVNRRVPFDGQTFSLRIRRFQHVKHGNFILCKQL